MNNREKNFDTIVALCKSRGFVFPGSEIYGGLANSWDYGPLGVEFKNNVKKAWLKKFVQESPTNVGLDAAIIMNPQTWVTTGHVAGFSDPLLDCKSCKARHRADKLVEDAHPEVNADAMSQEELENKIATLTGGRVAEELVFQSITTGASNDIEQATKLARAMITRFGMTDEFDMVALETVSNQYLGGDTSLACSGDTATLIDQKVVEVVKTQHDKARKLIQDNMPKMHELAKYLYEKETITGDEFMEILSRPVPQISEQEA